MDLESDTSDGVPPSKGYSTAVIVNPRQEELCRRRIRLNERLAHIRRMRA